MWDDDFQNPNQQGMAPGMNPMGPPPQEPMLDPYQLEQVRQEVEMAHEEFQRLLAGRPRLYSNFR